MYSPISFGFPAQLLVLFYIATNNICEPLDFQVGNYLHKFFKHILPNNTNFRRRPDDPDPYKKMYARIYSTEPGPEEDLPDIEGLTFKRADHELPTLPFENKSMNFETYNPLSTTPGTTPGKEALLRMAGAFKDIIMKKGGFMKDTFHKFKAYMKNEGQTIDPEAIPSRELNYNYDARLENAMNFAEDKMVKKIAELYTHVKQQAETTTAGLFNNFMQEMKGLYKEQMSNLFARPTPPPTEPPEPTERELTSSQERRDEENMRQLRMLDREFANESDVHEALKDIYTPRPSEEM